MRISAGIACAFVTVVVVGCSSSGTTTRSTTTSAAPQISPSTSIAPPAEAGGAPSSAPSASPSPSITALLAATADAALPDELSPALGTFAVVRVGEELRGVVPGQPPLWILARATVALDGSAVAATSMTADGLSVAVFDTRSGSRLGAWAFAPDAELRVVSPAGRWLALTRQVGSQTEVMVVDSLQGTKTSLQFEGRLEPEAFALDGRSVVALGYLADGRYRVQTIDLASGERWSTNDRWKAAEKEDMSGIPVRAVMNGDLLSTLYRDPTSTAHPAFVHTLNLSSGWSHCADLPAPFGTGPVGSDAVVNSVDGNKLYVASGGSFATIDVDAVRQPARDEHDVVAISISPTPPIDRVAFSTHGATWTTSGLVSLHDGAVVAGLKSTIVGPDAQLIAARG